MQAAGMDVEDWTSRLIKDIVERTSRDPNYYIARTMPVAWFAVPSLAKLVNHTEPDVRNLASRLIRIVQQNAEPPTVFENPERSVIDLAVESCVRRADEMLKEGKAADASLLVEKALRIDPFSKSAMLFGGVFALIRKDSVIALDYFEKILASNPSRVDVLLYKADALMLSNKWAEAQACCDRPELIGNPAAKKKLEICKQRRSTDGNHPVA